MARPETESLLARKRQLALSLDVSRNRLTTSGSDLRARLNPLRGFSGFVRGHPVQLFGATTLGVAVLTFLLRPFRKSRKGAKSGRPILNRLLLYAGKQLFRMWVLERARAYLKSQPIISHTESLLGR